MAATTDDDKRRNSEALIEHFKLDRLRINFNKDRNSPLAVQVLLDSSRKGEWHTLWAVMQVPHLGAVHDTSIIAKRLDVMTAEDRCAMEAVYLKHGG